MNPAVDPVSDADIDAYVDNELDIGRRIDIEAYLAAHPEVAARVMADLRTRDELRLAIAETAPAPSTISAARRLSNSLAFRAVLRRAHRGVALVMLIGIGWLGHELLGPIAPTEVRASSSPPFYVEEAIRAHGTSMLRASMVSQPEVPDFAAEEIRATTAIVMPNIPADWIVKDVQVFPSRFGPSVELAAEAHDLGFVSLFAVRPGTFEVVPATLSPGDEESSAYFQVGEIAYVLVGRGDARALERTADDLADTLY